MSDSTPAQAPSLPPYCAFQGAQQVAAGDLLNVALACRALQQSAAALVHIFDTHSGRVVDLDLRGSAEEVTARLAEQHPQQAGKRRRGRPRLGVVSREVTLLPRQWQWLSEQPGGASVTLRRLVDDARKDPEDARRRARDAVYRFATATAGDEAGFEEAMRALFAGDARGFARQIADWPEDIQRQVELMATACWAG